MSIGERIKQIRKENKLTLEKFGAYLKISPQSVSKLERGISNPSDQTVFLICREFHINEVWLRTGEGESHQVAYQDSLWEIVQSRGLDSADYALISGIMDMPANARKALIHTIIDVAERVKRGEPLPIIPATDAIGQVETGEKKGRDDEELKLPVSEDTRRKSWDEMTKEEKIAEFTRQLDEEEETNGEKYQSGGGASA